MGKLYNFAIFMCFWILCGGNGHWDYIIFSQKWPITFCIYYTDYMTDPVRKCIFPNKNYTWTIHGVWPSEFHHMGPFYCNSSVPFDEGKIDSIRLKLENFWPNLESDKSESSLWKHEWEKHGTCVLDFEPLNNELKYFRGGLDFYGKYNMTSLLSSLNIFPDKKKYYNAQHVINEIQKVLSVMPYIQCIHMADSKEIYLSEIRLCFNKNFDLIDCEPKHFHDFSSGCSGLFLYPKDFNKPENDY